MTATQDIGNTLQKAGGRQERAGVHQRVRRQQVREHPARHLQACVSTCPAPPRCTLILDPSASRDTANDAGHPRRRDQPRRGRSAWPRSSAGQQAKIDAALKDAARLGLPRGYTGKGAGIADLGRGLPLPGDLHVRPGRRPAERRAEPDDPALHRAGPADPLRRRDAKKLHLTPYDALIIASIAQSEAKFTGRHAQGRARDPEPHRGTACRCRSTRPAPTRRKLAGTRPGEGASTPDRQPVQHLHPPGPAADADRQPGRHAR